MPQVDNHAFAVLVIIGHVFHKCLAESIGERGIAEISHLAVADGMVQKASRGVVTNRQIVEHDHFFINVFLRIHFVIHRVVARHIEARNQVGVAVAERVEHGGTHTEEAVFAHQVVDLGTIHLAHRVPVDAFHIEEGVVLVYLVPKIVEHIDRILGFVFFHEGPFARGEGQKTKNEDMWFFHSVNQLILNIKDKLMAWRAWSKR